MICFAWLQISYHGNMTVLVFCHCNVMLTWIFHRHRRVAAARARGARVQCETGCFIEIGPYVFNHAGPVLQHTRSPTSWSTYSRRTTHSRFQHLFECLRGHATVGIPLSWSCEVQLYGRGPAYDIYHVNMIDISSCLINMIDMISSCHITTLRNCTINMQKIYGVQIQV